MGLQSTLCGLTLSRRTGSLHQSSHVQRPGEKFSLLPASQISNLLFAVHPAPLLLTRSTSRTGGFFFDATCVFLPRSTSRTRGFFFGATCAFLPRSTALALDAPGVLFARSAALAMGATGRNGGAAQQGNNAEPGQKFLEILTVHPSPPFCQSRRRPRRDGNTPLERPERGKAMPPSTGTASTYKGARPLSRRESVLPSYKGS